MSKYAMTEHNRFRKVQDAIRDVYRSAEVFGLSSDQVSEKANAVRVRYGKLTPYYAGKISGYEEALRETLLAKVRWVVYIDGKPMTSSEISALADKEESANPDGRLGTWKRSTGRHEWPDGRPFTEMGKSAWQFMENIEEDPDAYLACNGSDGLMTKLAKLEDSIV